MNKSKAIIPLVVSLVFLSLVPIAVRAGKPSRTYRYSDVFQNERGRWKTEISIISWKEGDIYRISAKEVFSWVGEEDMWVRVFHYKGTCKSRNDIHPRYLVDGMMTYTLQYTVFGEPDGDDGWDGNYRVWFENGVIVKQQGSGYFWIS